MRACVPVIVAALVAACGPNPAFKLLGASDDGGASGETGATTAGDGSTGDAPCEPRVREPAGDVCAPWQPLGITPPNLAKSSMFTGRACDEPLDITVKRDTDDTLIACPTGCDAQCFADLAIPISTAVTLPEVEPLLPAVGECARLWHVGSAVDDDPLVCESTAFALWTLDTRERLSLAVASRATNPFADVPGLDLTVTAGPAVACDAAQVNDDLCPDGADATPLEFSLGACQFTATQSELWEAIAHDGLLFKLDLYRAYSCDGQQNYAWYLRRAP